MWSSPDFIIVTFIPTLGLGQTQLTPVASTTQFFFRLAHWKCILNKTQHNNKSQKRLLEFCSGATTTMILSWEESKSEPFIILVSPVLYCSGISEMVNMKELMLVVSVSVYSQQC